MLLLRFRIALQVLVVLGIVFFISLQIKERLLKLMPRLRMRYLAVDKITEEWFRPESEQAKNAHLPNLFFWHFFLLVSQLDLLLAFYLCFFVFVFFG